MLKLNEMDFGTKLRTALAIATSINTALVATDLTGFENPTVDLIYKIASIIINFIVVALTAYFNNSYTHAGAIGTQVTRSIKADPTLIVDVIDGDEDDDEEEDDEDGDVAIEGDADEVE